MEKDFSGMEPDAHFSGDERAEAQHDDRRPQQRFCEPPQPGDRQRPDEVDLLFDCYSDQACKSGLTLALASKYPASDQKKRFET